VLHARRITNRKIRITLLIPIIFWISRVKYSAVTEENRLDLTSFDVLVLLK